MPALRFDYSGTGDSADGDPETDQIAAWCEDVIAAVAELQRCTGVERVCVLGFRIGALLAALAAARCSAITGLILIAPIVSGRRYVKELRTTRLAALLSTSHETWKDGSPGGSADRDGSLEVSGFDLSAATLASLAKIDLHHVPLRLDWGVLVIDNVTLPTAREWAAAAVQSGLDVHYQSASGMVEMLMTAPQFAVVPLATVVATQQWLSDKLKTMSRTPERAKMVPVRCHAGAQNVLTLQVETISKPLVLTERAVRFGPDRLLFGVVTEPSREERRRRAVILLNPGVDQHIGASRLYVSLARLWSARGYVVLRMDLAGIGDSDTRQGAREDDVFPVLALDDVRAAIAYLKDQYRVGDVTLGGLCSGGYHALRAAASGIMVSRILMINPQNYFWKEGMRITDLQVAEVLRNPGIYRHQVVSTAAWKRLLSGEVNLPRIAKVYLQRMSLALVSSMRDLARRLQIRLVDDLGRELEEISARGIGIVFVFARGEPGFDLLKLEAGRSLRRLGERCRILILPTGDHVFSHRDSRAELLRVLSDELMAPTIVKQPLS